MVVVGVWAEADVGNSPMRSTLPSSRERCVREGEHIDTERVMVERLERQKD
jgi:hypothetical protein